MKGTLYRLNSESTTPEFYWKLKMNNELKEPAQTYYYDAQKKIHTEETLVYEKGKLKEYSYIRHNINEQAMVTITDDGLLFTRTFNGQIKTSTKEYRKNYLFGPQIVTFIRDNFKALEKGTSIEINYGALNRLNAYRFILKRDRSHPLNSKDKLIIKMDADSFIVRQFADPIYFVLNKNGTKIHRIIGRALPASNINGKIGVIDSDFKIRD
ncbi:hypothetical protein DID80_08295 [Candidatus Marinamargulisbacteria bacterium SCGC AAA071-K20]|nr:hypothetical protein DID80_08295 [Candidatus Marinamargulisbacteria bacterium SCGC AAA071-K20]